MSTHIAKEFERLFALTFSVDIASVRVDLKIDDSLKTQINISSNADKIEICSDTTNGLLCSIYHFFELCGVHFGFSGEIPCAPLGEIPCLSIAKNPSIKNRGIRMHLNFVQDQSFFTEQEFEEFISNMSKMQFNYLLFHMYNSQEWYPFEYKGIRHLDLELGNLKKASLCDTMIGRDKVKTKRFWYPQELEDVEDGEALLKAMHAKYARMMEYASERGIKLAASFEPEVISEELERAVIKWSNSSCDELPKSLVNDWQSGWSGKKISEVDTLNPYLTDIGVERVLALSDAYPLISELHLISREGTAWQAQSPQDALDELARLSKSLQIEFDDELISALWKTNDDTSVINPKAYPYWTVLPGQSYTNTFIGGLRYLELACKILRDERVAKLQQDKGLEFVITLYSPNPITIQLLNKFAGKIVPKGVRYDVLGDYGANDIYENLDCFAPLIEDKNDIGLISWLEFDGNMMLAQGWCRSIYDNVKKARQMGIDTIYFNHWRVKSLEHNAKLAAATCFDYAKSYNEIISDYAEKLFGKACAEQAIKAYEKLESLTVFCKQHHYNIGFTGDWVYRYGVDTPGYDTQKLMQSSDEYEKLSQVFADIGVASQAEAKQHAHYLSALCLASSFHLKCVLHLQSAKLPLIGYGFNVANGSCANTPSADVLSVVLENAKHALSFAKAYMRTYAPYVKSCDEQGQLAHYHIGVIEPLEKHLNIIKEL